MNTRKNSVWPLIAAIVALLLLSAIIEPCDGHSCDNEVTYER